MDLRDAKAKLVTIVNLEKKVADVDQKAENARVLVN